jgi:hypothetical protein
VKQLEILDLAQILENNFVQLVEQQTFSELAGRIVTRLVSLLGEVALSWFGPPCDIVFWRCSRVSGRSLRCSHGSCGDLAAPCMKVFSCMLSSHV